MDAATTQLRGLCLLTSFKGSIPRPRSHSLLGMAGRKDTTEEAMLAPPVLLLAASDGTVSFHYCRGLS